QLPRDLHSFPTRRSSDLRDTQQRRLSAADELPLLAGALIAGAAVRTRIVGCKERADDELASFERPDSAADLFNDAAVFVSHRRRSEEHTSELQSRFDLVC